MGLFVLDITGAVLVTLCMIIVEIGVIGITMHYLGYNFTGESVTALIITPILCLEFTFHSASYFLEGTKANDEVPNNTRSRRLYWLLVDRGTSVVCSTIVLASGTLVLLIFAGSPVNKNFAIVFISAVGLIFYHAILVLPVLLSWIGTVYPGSTITGYFLEQAGGGGGRGGSMMDSAEQSLIDPVGVRLLGSLNWDGDHSSRESSAININEAKEDRKRAAKGGTAVSPSFSSSPNVAVILREEDESPHNVTISRIDYGSLNLAIPEDMYSDSPADTPW